MEALKPIFVYENYREYLRDYYEWQKKAKPFFTYRHFAQKSGLGSHMHLRLVIVGKRNLSHKSIPKFVRGLALKRREAEYFQSLVLFNQTEPCEEKLKHLGDLQRIRKITLKQKANSSDQEHLFCRHYLPLVYELVHHKDFLPEAEFIFRSLKKVLTLAQAKEAVEILRRSGLWKQTASGKWEAVHAHIDADDEVENLLVRAYHRRMAEMALDKFDAPLPERELGFLTVCSSPENFKKLKERVKVFIQEANDLMTLPDDSGTLLYQLNVQLFSVP